MQVVGVVVHRVVADPHDLEVLELFAGGHVLGHGEEVTQHLSGMHAGRAHAGEHRHRGPLGQLEDSLLRRVADLDAVNHAQKHQRRVLEGLAPLAHVHGLGLQVEGVAAQLVHRRLEGDAGAGRRLVEHQGKGLALEEG